MTVSPQIQDMDAKQIAERHLIERYLAGQLSEADSDAFESLVASQPGLAMQVEQVARMKTGLEVLRRRGDLARLLQGRPKTWYRSPWVAVAAAASVVLVVFLTMQIAAPPAAMIASTLAELADSKGSAPRIAATYLLTSERSAAPPAQIQVSKIERDAVELRFDAAAGTGDQFKVEILRAEGDSLRSIARANKVPASGDGSVAVYVAARVLAPGNYLFRLTPAGSDVSLEFSAHVEGS
jgi:hypothetical protein